LAHLTEKRQQEGFAEPTPKQLKDAAKQKRHDANEAVVALFLENVEPAVINEAALRSYLGRYGPFDPERVTAILDRILESTPKDLHVEVYLDAIRKQIEGDAS